MHGGKETRATDQARHEDRAAGPGRRTERSSARLARLLDVVAAGVLATDGDGRVTYANAAAGRLLGRRAEDLVGRRLDDPAIGLRVEEGGALLGPGAGLARQARRSQAGEGLRLSLVRSDGGRVELEVDASPLSADDGGPGLALVMRDVTSRVTVERERAHEGELLGEIFRHAPVGIAVLRGPEHRFALANRPFAELVGRRAGALVGRTVGEALPELSDAIVPLLDQVWKAGRPYQANDVRYPVRRGGGPPQTGWFSYSFTPLRDETGRLDGLLVLARETTAELRARRQAESERARLRTVLDTLPIGVLITDASGRIVEANAMASSVWGGAVPLAQRIEDYGDYKAWRVDTGQPVAPHEWALARALLHGETNVNEQFDIERFDGICGTIVSSAAPLRDGDGTIVGAVAVMQDVTRERLTEEALRQSEARLNALFEGSPVALGLVDTRLRFEKVNPVAAAMLHRPVAALLGRPAERVTRRAAAGIVRHLRRVLATGEADLHVEDKGPLPGAQGRVGHWLTSYFPVKTAEGDVSGVGFAAVDVTAQTETQAALRSLTDELDERVRERTSALEAANRELEAFAYSVSHDLRAPLQSIDGFSKALLEDYGADLDPVGQQYLERVRANAQRMALLIDDLLHLSRVSRTEMHSEPVDLSELALAVLDELRSREPDRRVQIRIERNLVAAGDRRLLRLLLENLLGNAWKFTGQRERARIEVGREETAAGLAFFVRDDGAGFEMAYADKLFSPFQRLHTDDEFPGTGIGGAIIQRVVQRHGGELWAYGEPGRGATFWFTLPGGGTEE